MNNAMLDDTRKRQLIEQARKGDQRAFEELFELSRERLLATIRSHLSAAIRQRTDPEDVLQDTFVRALHSVERFEWQGENSFRRWLESIATHVVRDVVRRQRRRTVLQFDRDLEGVNTSPSRAMRRNERFERLRASMKTLSPDYQTVLKLSRMEGLPIREIARRMARSESAVKNLLLRATRQLKQSFGDTESLNLGERHLDDEENR